MILCLLRQKELAKIRFGSNRDRTKCILDVPQHISRIYHTLMWLQPSHFSVTLLHDRLTKTIFITEKLVILNMRRTSYPPSQYGKETWLLQENLVPKKPHLCTEVFHKFNLQVYTINLRESWVGKSPKVLAVFVADGQTRDREPWLCRSTAKRKTHHFQFIYFQRFRKILS